MPEEPHKNIEDALKAYAQQRRDASGGPLDMPPHTRAVLQREIAQRAAARPPEPQRRLAWLVAAWPRLAVGAAMVVVAGMTLFMLTEIGTKPKTPLELAQAEPQGQSLALLDYGGKAVDASKKLDEKLSKDFNPASVVTRSAPAFNATQMAGGGPERNAAETAAAKTMTTDGFAGVKVAMESKPAKAQPKKAELAGDMTIAPPPPVAVTTSPGLASVAQSAMPAPAESLPATAPGGAGRAITTETSRLITAGVSNAAAPGGAGRAEATETTRLITAAASNMAPLSQRLHFAQVAANNETETPRQSRQPPPSPQVLTTFQLEQAGDRVVITDADGSVYEGRIQLADAAQQQVVQRRRTSRVRIAPQQAAPPRQVMTQGGEFIWRGQNATGQSTQSAATQLPLYFTASGMNRSVNQRVVVNGVLTSPADGELAYGPTAAGGRLAFDSLAARGSNAPATPATPPPVAKTKAVVTEPGQLVLPPAAPGDPVPAMPQASAQIEGTLRVGDAPETDLTAVGVGP